LLYLKTKNDFENVEGAIARLPTHPLVAGLLESIPKC